MTELEKTLLKLYATPRANWNFSYSVLKDMTYEGWLHQEDLDRFEITEYGFKKVNELKANK